MLVYSANTAKMFDLLKGVDTEFLLPVIPWLKVNVSCVHVYFSAC